ncbi:metal-dependent hydrolase [Maribacter sp. 4U21]|uniref:cyclase family protein n=1 Tax=Maribacter sp. 4U21 TaxID=1889779 RepID=UPI000C52241C|nr:cyclase family protein [Maribacter sp. 4U21]PIB27390.1 metal-dependent hydrolase [Maribacter sp. 4U21]
MKAKIIYKKKDYKINLSKPLDISMPLKGDQTNVNAWYVNHPKIEPHKEGDFIGSVAAGASTNFNDISFNPHAHGTHTECVGHITKDFKSVNKALNSYFFLAELITLAPGKVGNDFVISKKQLQNAIKNADAAALVIRTLPNTATKITRQYSNTNPPYLLEEAAMYLREKGITHLLIDLPSIDKEKDNGALLAHKAFWDFNGDVRHKATITEFIYVPNTIADGAYFLNLQVAPFENDASPSRPVLYKIK